MVFLLLTAPSCFFPVLVPLVQRRRSHLPGSVGPEHGGSPAAHPRQQRLPSRGQGDDQGSGDEEGGSAIGGGEQLGRRGALNVGRINAPVFSQESKPLCEVFCLPFVSKIAKFSQNFVRRVLLIFRRRKMSPPEFSLFQISRHSSKCRRVNP